MPTTEMEKGTEDKDDAKDPHAESVGSKRHFVNREVTLYRTVQEHLAE